MKITQLCLVITVLTNLFCVTALGCDQVRNTVCNDISAFLHPNIRCMYLKCSPVIGAGLGGAITGAVVYLNYSTETTYLLPLNMLSGTIIGAALGCCIAYAATKMYESCVLRLQHRQNSDDPA